MEEILASVKGLNFEFEAFVRDSLGIGIQERKRGEVCKYFLKGTCTKGNSCTYKHTRPEKAVVCKHWLRGLCKKGEKCEFLHEYNLKKMPECWFFSKYGECSNPECQYLHIDPNSRAKECLWYARGFCKHGPECRNKHVRKLPCPLYLFGFCPFGPTCSNGHPKFEIPTQALQAQEQQELILNLKHGLKQDMLPMPQEKPFQPRSLEDVTCYKCQQKGHYANRCSVRVFQ